MNSFTYLYKAFIRNYLPILAGMLLSFVAIIIVFTLLLHIKDFFSYYENISAGFIPEVKVRFDQDLSRRDMRKIIDDINRSHSIDSTQFGYIKQYRQARFDLDAGFASRHGRSMAKDISVIGFAYEGTRQIELFQEGQQFDTKIIYIDYFGNWVIKIEKAPGMKAVDSHLMYGGQKIAFETIDFGSYFTLSLKHPQNTAQLKQLYNFLIDFVQRFVSLENTGITSNRFESGKYSDKEIYNRQVFIKRKLLDCLKLLFSENSTTVNAMLSSPLYHSISRYNQIQKANLNVRGEHLALRIVDFFNINAEKIYNNNVVLMNYKDFSNIFETGSRYNLLHIYGSDFSDQSVAEQIKFRYPGAGVTLRKNAIPTLHAQSRLFTYGIYALLALFCIVVGCIVLVRLFKFYMVFKYDLIFLKIYGYRGHIFTRLLLVIFLTSAAVAYFAIDYLIFLHNRVLSKYYFPEISLDLFSFGIPLGVCATMLIGVYFLERNQLANLEYGSRGDT